MGLTRRLLFAIFSFIMLSTPIAYAFQSRIGFMRVLPPRGLTYSTPSPTYTKWTTITNNTPSFAGGAPATTWSISPALPAGLSFSTVTGIISSAPTGSPSSGTYTVTASNPGGSTTVDLTISVVLSNFTWVGGTGTNWSTGANWKGSSAPGATDIAIFDNECAATCDATIDVSPVIRAIQMKSNYTGTITQSGANTIALGTNSGNTPYGFEIDGGTFTGGSGNIRADYIRLTAGTFTSTSGELRLGFDAQWGVGSSNGFTLGSTAVFNHNNGTLYIDALTGSTGSRLAFTFTLDRSLVLYNFDFDDEDTSADQKYNSSHSDIKGTVPQIDVLNGLNFRDGYLRYGTVRFYGSNVNFYCDSPTTPQYCSGTETTLNITGAENGLTQLEFDGATAQTYTFQDGAGAPTLVINNAAGVTPAGGTGRFIVSALTINTGSFTAPSSTLVLMGDLGAYIAGTTFTVGAGGTFVHNNGTLLVEGNTTYGDQRRALGFSISSGTVSFYNFTLNFTGDINDSQVNPDQNYVNVPTGTTINVMHDLRVQNSRFSTTSSASTAKLVIKGNYYRECADLATHRCADTDSYMHKVFDTAGSTINIDANAEEDCLGCTVTIDPGAGNTVTVNSPWNLNWATGTLPNLTVTSGILNVVAGGSILVGNILTNNAAITCSGGGIIQAFGSIAGTPGGGNNPACYSTTPPDAVATAVDWIDFSGTSSLQTISGVSLGVYVQLSAVNVTGTPTIKYRWEGSGASWTTFTTAAPATLQVANGDSLEFQVTGTTGDSATITIKNLSNASAVLDTVTGTVP